MIVSKKECKKLIEPFFFKYLKPKNYIFKNIDPNKLMTPSRLDIAFKLLFLNYININKKLAIEIYSNHINALTLGSNKEPGKKAKKNISIYIKQFKHTFDSIKKNGFNFKKTLIPVSNKNHLCNGAHRVASSIYLNNKIALIKLGYEEHLYDYKFFYKRKTKLSYLNMAALTFIDYSRNVYLAFIWPTANVEDSYIEKKIPNILYKKDISLTHNGSFNLITQVYKNEPWLGNKKNKFQGARSKMLSCFKKKNKLRVVLFMEKNLKKVIKIKEDFRKPLKKGNHSIHITDNHKETKILSKLVLNENNLHFLNYSKPNKYLSTEKKIKKFKKFLILNNISFSDVILDGGMVLSLYGIREARDIDYLHIKETKLNYTTQLINSHSSEIRYHKKRKEDLIYDPKYYFIFQGLKFCSFNQIYQMKKNRFDEKDKIDIKLMESLNENNLIKKWVTNAKQQIYYSRIKFYWFLINFLKNYKLFNFFRNIYRFIKKIKNLF